MRSRAQLGHCCNSRGINSQHDIADLHSCDGRRAAQRDFTHDWAFGCLGCRESRPCVLDAERCFDRRHRLADVVDGDRPRVARQEDPCNFTAAINERAAWRCIQRARACDDCVRDGEPRSIGRERVGLVHDAFTNCGVAQHDDGLAIGWSGFREAGRGQIGIDLEEGQSTHDIAADDRRLEHVASRSLNIDVLGGADDLTAREDSAIVTNTNAGTVARCKTFVHDDRHDRRPHTFRRREARVVIFCGQETIADGRAGIA